MKFCTDFDFHDTVGLKINWIQDQTTLRYQLTKTNKNQIKNTFN